MPLQNKPIFHTHHAATFAALFALSLLLTTASCQGGAEEGGQAAYPAPAARPGARPRPPRRPPGKKSASAPTSRQVSGCQLLTVEEVSQALGAESKQGRRAFPGCEWSIEKTRDKLTIDLPPVEHARQLLRSAKEVVPDLGEGAFLSMNSPGVAVLTVIQGEKAFTLGVVLPFNRSFKDRDSIAIAKKLAKIVLSRL